MDSKVKCRSREFSASEISAEIKVSISHGHDEDLLFNAIKNAYKNGTAGQKSTTVPEPGTALN